jgi:hypothetical protein
LFDNLLQPAYFILIFEVLNFLLVLDHLQVKLLNQLLILFKSSFGNFFSLFSLYPDFFRISFLKIIHYLLVVVIEGLFLLLRLSSGSMVALRL